VADGLGRVQGLAPADPDDHVRLGLAGGRGHAVDLAVRALAAEDLLDQVDLGASERALDCAPDQPPDVLVGDHKGVLAQVTDVLADGSHDPAALDVLARSNQRL
jgi:hypothetical protein